MGRYKNIIPADGKDRFTQPARAVIPGPPHTVIPAG